ncbi:MAG: hypothetical protein KAT65_04210, partial [Methanophagales archaeon]|nr:hypothetical protein [Methanophagales archaeon]
STFFVIGGIMLSKHFFFLKKKICAKRKSIDQTASQNLLSKSVEGGNCSEVLAYLTILLVLLPYFLCSAGITYAMFGEPRSVILSSEGEQYDLLFVHDQDSYCAKWLSEYNESNLRLHADHSYGIDMMISQGKRKRYTLDSLFKNEELTTGYI